MIHLELCENILFAIGGVDKKQLNEVRLEFVQKIARLEMLGII